MKRRLLEYGLLATGFACLAVFGSSYLKYQSFQSRDPVVSKAAVTARQISGDPHPVIGRVSVRRLGFSVSMVEGDDEDSLDLAAGHMPGTAMAGQTGNMVIAGHRDSAFWPLRKIRTGDRIEVQASQKAVYRVQDIHVVNPSNLTDLDDTGDAVLTLVTCYPFHHVGPAPQRFIVRAKLCR